MILSFHIYWRGKIADSFKVNSTDFRTSICFIFHIHLLLFAHFHFFQLKFVTSIDKTDNHYYSTLIVVFKVCLVYVVCLKCSCGM